jgi:hypothetical protein
MNNTDKITRDAKLLIESAKDTAANNLLVAIKTNSLDLSEVQLKKVLTLLNISMEEGYQKAVPTFQKMVKNYVNTKPVK